jgi:hypothetical protein
LGYWGIGVLVMLAPTSATALPKNCDKNFCTVGICVSSSIDHDALTPLGSFFTAKKTRPEPGS